MRIALIVPAPFDTISGGYIYDRRIVSGLREAGHPVDVVELAGNFPLADARARAAARAAWDRLSSDVIPLIDGLALPAFDELDHALFAGGAIGLVHHPVSMETGLNEADQATLAAVERRLFRRLKRLIVTSPTTAETVTARFVISPAKVCTIVPGTEIAPRSMGSAGPACELLSIGTLIPRKGVDVLLQALSGVAGLDWHLTIVGSRHRDPAHAAALLSLARQLQIAQRVRFVDELVGDALETAWRQSDVFVSATHYEGYGMAIAEALQRGLPVVVTAGGAAGSLIRPGAGFVCPVGDHARLAGSLRLLICDRDVRRAMAEQAWQTGQTLPSWHAQSALFASALI